MRFQLSSLFTILFVLVPTMSHTLVIGFEDLAPRDPWGNIIDGWGTLPQGYQGFGWSNDFMGDTVAGAPQWASVQGYMTMPGIGGQTYVHTQGFLVADNAGTFDVVSLKVGSYFYRGQDVYAKAWENGSLKYSTVLAVDPAFSAAPITLDYDDIDRFALWTGDGGIPVGSDLADYELCIDDISFNPHGSSPVPEPSTLIIAGAGLLGLARICRRSKNMPVND